MRRMNTLVEKVEKRASFASQLEAGHAYRVFGGEEKDIQSNCFGCGAPFPGLLQQDCDYCGSPRKVFVIDITSHDISHPDDQGKIYSEMPIFGGGRIEVGGESTRKGKVMGNFVIIGNLSTISLVGANDTNIGYNARVNTLIARQVSIYNEL